MRILIDTNILIWQLEGNEKLSAKFRKILADEANEIFISVVSLWEMTIKASKERLELHETVAEWVPDDANLLHILPEHLQSLKSLPFHHNHKDPFDRLLKAQALNEKMAMMSADGEFGNYGLNLL